MSETLNFKPYARLLTMLGDQLIKNERIALVEIIKNSYDADASWVRVTFSRFGPKFEIKDDSSIIIEDDGIGMTEAILREHWVSPATPLKKVSKQTEDTTPKGRKIQGEKGIGRFAILKLGKTISITTRPQGNQQEYTLDLDLSPYDDDFLTKNGKAKPLFLKDIDLTLSRAPKAKVICPGTIELGARKLERLPHGTRIEIRQLRGAWTPKKIEDVYEDLIRLQSIFDEAKRSAKAVAVPAEPMPGFDVAIYKDAVFQSFPTKYIADLRQLISDKPVFRITDGIYDEARQTFKFHLNGKPRVLPLSDPEITSLKLFRDIFGDHGENLTNRGTRCGSFGFGFFVFDFNRDPNSKYYLDKDDRKILKAHRIYLYRDNIRVLPYGDPDDDWLQIDAYRGTISAAWFLSNDQVVGHVDITQKGNPALRDKTNREGLIDIGNATADFIHLLQVFLAWVRKAPYARYVAELKKTKSVDIVRKQQVQASLDALEEKIGDNKAAQAALAETSRLYKLERSYLIQRAESTENLAGVGLSVETAAHDIMAVMHRGLVALDALILETQKTGALAKEIINRELISLRGMFSFIEAQLSDIQLLFKSTKQRRRDIRVREVLQKVHKLFEASLKKENIAFEIVERGSPLMAKTTDAVLLQLFLNLFDNAVYWLKSKAGRRHIEVLLDGDGGKLIFADNGPGVNADDAPYIFEPFYSGRGEDGRGLGLYIARQLLERHDYSIELADTKRERVLGGANFVVSFVEEEG
ncbi:MAG: ATP-binding protein [Terracidiphilus sp.]|jgi:signal transduction histidine kinase